MSAEQNKSPPVGSRVIEVRQFASQDRCDRPGYYRYFHAFDEDGNLICAVSEPSQPGARNDRVFVRSERVWSPSGTGYEAILRFLEWETSGKPHSWLMFADDAAALAKARGQQ